MLNDSRTPVSAKGRQKWAYECAMCNKKFAQKQVEVDHIEPVGSLNNYRQLSGFVRRLFVSKDKLRVVCKPCHVRITHGK